MPSWICSNRALEASLAAIYSFAASLAWLGIPRPPSRTGRPIIRWCGAIGSLGPISLDARRVIACKISVSAYSHCSLRPSGSNCRCRCRNKRCILPRSSSRAYCLARSLKESRALASVFSLACKNFLRVFSGPMCVPRASRPCSFSVVVFSSVHLARFSLHGESVKAIVALSIRLSLSLLRI
jgi:hypothetical protein